MCVYMHCVDCARRRCALRLRAFKFPKTKFRYFSLHVHLYIVFVRFSLNLTLYTLRGKSIGEVGSHVITYNAPLRGTVCLLFYHQFYCDCID